MKQENKAGNPAQLKTSTHREEANKSLPLITQWELLVLLDALHGSLRFADGGTIWRWSVDQRKGVLDEIYSRMNRLPVSKADAEVSLVETAPATQITRNTMNAPTENQTRAGSPSGSPTCYANLGLEILALIRSKADAEWEYYNPNFLLAITEEVREYYQAKDKVVDNWVQEMFSA